MYLDSKFLTGAVTVVVLSACDMVASTRVVFNCFGRPADAAEREGAHGVVEECAVTTGPRLEGDRRLGGRICVATGWVASRWVVGAGLLHVCGRIPGFFHRNEEEGQVAVAHALFLQTPTRILDHVQPVRP